MKPLVSQRLNRERVFSLRLSNPGHCWQGDSCSLPCVIMHVVLQKRFLLPSGSCLTYYSNTGTNMGGFDVMSHKKKNHPPKEKLKETREKAQPQILCCLQAKTHSSKYQVRQLSCCDNSKKQN